MPDGTTIEISSDDEESWTELKSWYDDNPNSDERPSIQYPVNIIYEIDDFYSKSPNFAKNHGSDFLSHRAPKGTVRTDFVYTFTFLSLQAH